ncbi:MAG: hypothetical protein K2M89_06420 [Clostridiales bacterium]|nr:hypothetical protein [Clostridiales bacterium]
MKIRYILFTILHALFCAVVPIVFIFIQYGDTSGGLQYKLPLAAILIVVLVLILAKNTLLRPRITRMIAEIAQHEADLKVESDSGRIANLISELKRERTTEVILNAAVPLLVLSALLIGCKALERSALMLSGAIGFALASYAVGTVFGVLAARQVWAKHGGNDK